MHRLLRRPLGLPARRCASDVEQVAVPMPDGVRLATTHVWPVGGAGPRPTILVRTPYGVHTRPPAMIWLGRLLAESGYHVVLQDVRGRYASEGSFEPFVNEAGDGAATLDWLAAQRWCEGPVGLIGASYLAYTAWAAAAERPARVGALAIAIGSSDLYPVFHPHGVFALANALEWAAGVGDREGIARRHVDLERAFAHEPVREADRVARTEVGFYRTWVDHPTRDGYWDGVRAPLPEPAPPTIFVAGWWDFFLEPQLADYAALDARARRDGGERPRLVLGPWAHGPVAHRRFWRHGLQRRGLARMIGHFDSHLAGRTTAPTEPVRFFVCDPRRGGAWRSSDAWPPPGAETLTLHLHAGSPMGDVDEAPADAPGVIEIAYDPTDPTPSVGGALFGWKAGAKDQRGVAERGDVAVLRSQVLPHDLVVAGEVTARLFVDAEYAPADFAVHLVDEAPGGALLEVGDGLARLSEVGGSPGSSPEPSVEGVGDGGDEPAPFAPDASRARELAVSLAHRAWRFRAGHRVRLHLAPAHCPRFARARPPGLDDEAPPPVGRQWVFCAPDLRSRIELPLLRDDHPADGSA